RTYGDVSAGEFVALIGSDATLEIGVRDGSVTEVLGVVRGAGVTITATRA
ncbi:MAG: SAM hydroxide adenosyltransferase, partial [Longimicrobiales bacterium]